MKRIIIVGAGGMAREVASLIRALNKVEEEYLFGGFVVTDIQKLGDRDSKKEVVGDFGWLDAKRREIDAVAIGVGAPETRLKLYSEVKGILPDALWPILVHPTAQFETESAILGDAVFIGAGFVGTVNLRLEALALCNFGSTVGHESVVGKGSVVNPGANISGGVTIGAGVQIGTGAQVLQYLSIGDGASIGAGAVVTEDVASGLTVVGIPARPIPPKR